MLGNVGTVSHGNAGRALATWDIAHSAHIARRFTLGFQGARRLTRGSRVPVVSLVIPYSSPFFRKNFPENS